MVETLDAIIRQGIQFVVEEDPDTEARHRFTLVCLGQDGKDYEPVKGFGGEPDGDQIDHWIAEHFKKFLPWSGGQPPFADYAEEFQNLYRVTDKGSQPTGDWMTWQDVADWLAEGNVGTYVIEVAGR